MHDDVGGLADLAARRVRFIGDPAARIREDYLRSLRFFRFHAAFGAGAPDAAALAAIVALRGGLATLSRERVRAELLKLMAAPGAAAMARVMAERGILTPLLAGRAAPRPARPPPRHRDGARPRAGCAAPPRRPDPVRHRGCGPAARAAPPRERRGGAPRRHGRRPPAPRTGGRGRGGADRALPPRPGSVRRPRPPGLGRFRAPPDDAAWRALLGLPQRWTAPVFPIDGHALAAHGVAGPRLGALLGRLEEEWIAAGFPADAAWPQAAIARALALPKG